MAKRPILDLDLLRTLVVLAEERSFTRTGERIGRTQSAVTLQLQKLEDLIGRSLMTRAKGSAVELTPEGHALVKSAQAMLALNDEVFGVLEAPDLPATIRLGTSSTYTPFYLERTLEDLRSKHPTLLVEVTEGNSCQVAPHIRNGAYDLVVCEGGMEPRDWKATEIWRGPLRWITSTQHFAHRLDPVPLCLPPGQCPWRPAWQDDCFWRSAALRTLERGGVGHRVVASSSSMEGLYAPALAGNAITVTHGGALPPGLRVLQDDEGLPPLPEGRVVMIQGRNAAQPITNVLADAIQSAFRLE